MAVCPTTHMHDNFLSSFKIAFWLSRNLSEDVTSVEQIIDEENSNHYRCLSSSIVAFLSYLQTHMFMYGKLLHQTVPAFGEIVFLRTYRVASDAENHVAVFMVW